MIKEFAIERGFQLVTIKNEKSRVTAHCGSKGCEWRIHDSPLPDGITYKIKSIGGEHTCLRTKRNAEATSRWIAQKFMKALRNNPLMSISTMHDEMIERFGLEATRMQLYRGKRKALDAIEGSHANSYTLLPKYAGELMKTNPGSLVKLELERILPNLDIPTFKRIFISLAAIPKGFKEGCRTFIGLDGCHLKGPFGGVLLAAIALDGNNGLFPLAVAVVEFECKESWRFFLYYLHTILDDGPQYKAWTIMSDGQKGIENALIEIMPEVTHRRCCRHLFNNFKAKFPSLILRRSFWAACRAYTVLDFNSTMAQIREASELAYNWLMELPVEQWSRHTFDTRVTNDHVTNNLVESFNNWVGNIKGKPILAVLESIRHKLMEKLHSRFEKAITWKYLICPIIRKKLDEVQAQSRTCKISFAGQNEYQVREGISAFIVNLSFKTCCCRVWQVSGIPCKHAVACISHIRGNIENYYDEVYFKHVYFSAYGDIVHPIHDEGMWDDVSGDLVQPPPLRRLPGRPRKNRRMEVDEGAPGPSQYRRSSTIRCFICKEIGHNKRIYQRAPVRGRGNSTGTNKGNGVPQTMRGKGISIGGFTNTIGNEVSISQGSMYGSIRGRETSTRGRGVSVQGRGGFFRGRGSARERASLKGINLARGTNSESGSKMVGLPEGGSQAVAQPSE